MNARRLKQWKSREVERAEALVSRSPPQAASDILALYPEFDLSGAYTTSLDPYVPIWALLPFFERVIVGITPYLRTEEEFIRWYGLSVRQVLALREKGRIAVRVLFPDAARTAPSYLNPFFEGDFPSTARDLLFDRELLGADKQDETKERFAKLVAGSTRSTSIDGLRDHKRRAYNTARTAYLQLHALGYGEQARQFEAMLLNDEEGAFAWLELCRLFLIGPVHYSLCGIHSVAASAHVLKRPTMPNTHVFPGELGKIVVDAMDLVTYRPRPGSISLDDCVSAYSDYAGARSAVLALDNALKSGEEAACLTSAAALRGALMSARRSKRSWLRTLRIVAATGIAAAVLPLNPLVGLLLGLGFTVTAELPSKPIDKVLTHGARVLGARWTRPHISMLIDLQDDVKESFDVAES